jgi:hypothetical protein
MPKKCIICGKPAKFLIKGTSDYYCEECAEENFAEISMLQTVEEKETEETNISAEETDEDADDEQEDDGLEEE